VLLNKSKNVNKEIIYKKKTIDYNFRKFAMYATKYLTNEEIRPEVLKPTK